MSLGIPRSCRNSERHDLGMTERHRRNPHSWRKDLLILEKDALSRFGKRKAKDITRRDIITMLDEIVSRGAPIQANRTLEIIRKLFNWAVARDVLGANPCYRVPKPRTVPIGC